MSWAPRGPPHLLTLLTLLTRGPTALPARPQARSCAGTRSFSQGQLWSATGTGPREEEHCQGKGAPSGVRGLLRAQGTPSKGAESKAGGKHGATELMSGWPGWSVRGTGTDRELGGCLPVCVCVSKNGDRPRAPRVQWKGRPLWDSSAAYTGSRGL